MQEILLSVNPHFWRAPHFPHLCRKERRWPTISWTTWRCPLWSLLCLGLPLCHHQPPPLYPCTCWTCSLKATKSFSQWAFFAWKNLVVLCRLVAEALFWWGKEWLVKRTWKPCESPTVSRRMYPSYPWKLRWQFQEFPWVDTVCESSDTHSHRLGQHRLHQCYCCSISRK